jgi:hypothetical protein
MPLLKEWESFYVIVGSAAAALTGLQFVAAALIADIDAPATSGSVDAFATPTIVHFSGVLLISAALSAPWKTMTPLAILLGIAGVAGVVYAMIIARRSRRQREYQPVFEDWLFHVILPACAYTTLIAGGYFVRTAAAGLFVVATAVMLLLLIGIHNAWDTLTYLIVVRRQGNNSPDRPAGTSPPTDNHRERRRSG